MNVKKEPRWQIGIAAVFLGTYAAFSYWGTPSFRLTAMSDISGTVLWVFTISAMLWSAFRNHGRARWFWLLMAVGSAMVCTNLAAWLYYEVFRGVQPPDPFWGDIPLFLQPVPLMAAAAMRPESKQPGEKFYLSSLNFLILLLWWVFLYMFLIYPNEFILNNKEVFNRYYYILFVTEFCVMLAAFGGLALASKGKWRTIYWNLFFAGALYLVAYQWLNSALERDEYFSGSLYDVPNYAAVCWFALIAWNARNDKSEQPKETDRHAGGGISAVLAMFAVLSLPLIGLGALLLDAHDSRVRTFRLSVTLAGILAVGICVFLRQYLLTRELARSLDESGEHLERLQRAQSQLMQRERMAGVGQLVAGVAHELNNPLTAVIGYSDLLVDQAGDSNIGDKLKRLGAEARRIRQIIDNLLNFARPQFDGKRQTDLAKLARESLMLCEYQLRSNKIDVAMNIAPDLPKLELNEGQFKQIFLNLFNNCASALENTAEKRIIVDAREEEGQVVLKFTDSGPGFTDVKRAFDPFYTTRPIGKGTGLGLSVCYGTVKEHGGEIQAENLDPHGAAVIIKLPLR